MFSISTFKSRIVDSNNVLKILKDEGKHDFDLLNENYYDEEGRVIENLPNTKIRYKEKFLELLREKSYQIVQILDHHYSKTENKELFYNYVKVDLSRNSTLDTDSINEWIDNVKKLPNNEIKKDELLSISNENSNDIVESTIDDYLIEFNENGCIDDSNYKALKEILKYYFDKGFFTPKQPVIIVKKVPLKKFAFALSQLYRDLRIGKLDVNYLKFAKQHISLFKNTSFDENDYTKSNLYKYFNTKT